MALSDNTKQLLRGSKLSNKSGLSSSTLAGLGYKSTYTPELTSTERQLANATTRLSSVGEEVPESKPNFLIRALDVLSRTGYGANNALREVSNYEGGATPNNFDPLSAFMRGVRGEERTSGKDVISDIMKAQGQDPDIGLFGGKSKWYNPSTSGVVGLGLDIVNPLDPVNLLAPGMGKTITKGTARGADALTHAFGSKGKAIAEILSKTDKVDNLGAKSVGELMGQVERYGLDAEEMLKVKSLMKQGVTEKGLKVTDKLDFKEMKPLQLKLQNPFSISPSGVSIKAPGYKATKGKARIPIINIGKDTGKAFNIPGSEHLTYAVSKITDKVGKSRIGKGLNAAFNTAFVPDTVPTAVVKRSLTASNMNELLDIAKATPDQVPLNVKELMALNDELEGMTHLNKFDFDSSFKAPELKALNKGEYTNLSSISKTAGLRDMSLNEIIQVLGDNPFEKNILEIYDTLKRYQPQTQLKDIFVQSAKLRKVLDNMYDVIPEVFKPAFKGVVSTQATDIYPQGMNKKLGSNAATSPMLAYTFDYKGVPVSVVVNQGENFNVNVWNKLSATFEALDELPETSIQAIKGQIELSPVPIMEPDTSMTLGDTIVLGRVDKPTVAHEYGHIWDSMKGDPESYKSAILGDAGKNGGNIDIADIYSDYARTYYDLDFDTGIKEDLADSVADYVSDNMAFRGKYPNRAQAIDKLINDNSISKAQLDKLVSDQKSRAEKISQVPKSMEQVQDLIKSVETHVYNMKIEPGESTFQNFQGNLADLFEQTNWQVKQFEKQVDFIFRGSTEAERKEILDIAGQLKANKISKTDIPETDLDELINSLPDEQIDRLSSFLGWRESIAKDYLKLGIPMEVIEQYVPFIPTRALSKAESQGLKTMFGTGNASPENIGEDLLTLQRLDPNLKHRTTQATRPSQVNAVLEKPWLTEDAAIAMSVRGARAIKAQEFTKFADDFVQQYGMGIKDLAVATGSEIPAGYKAYRIATDTTGTRSFREVTDFAKTMANDTDIVFLPQDMVKAFDNYADLAFNRETRSTLLRLYDQANNFFKKTAYLWNPGHIVRDFQGNVFNNFLMGVNSPAEYVEALKILRNPGEGVLSTPKGDLLYSDIMEKAGKMGIMETQIATEIPTTLAKPESKYTTLMRKATYNTDGWTRMTGFIHNLKEGMSYDQAATVTKKFLFDYQDLTTTERKVFRRIIPFYTWLRKNIPLQVEMLFKQPRVYSRLNKMYESANGGPVDWENEPEYIKESMAIKPFGGDNYVGLNMPYNDLSMVGSPGKVLSSVSPFIRAPIEMATNREWWTGQDIEGYNNEQQEIPVISTLLKAITGDSGPTIDKRYLGHILDNIPLSNRVDNLLGILTGQGSSSARNLSHISTTLGGPVVYDAESAKKSGTYQEKQRAVDYIQYLQDQGKEVPTTKEIKDGEKGKGKSRYKYLRERYGG